MIPLVLLATVPVHHPFPPTSHLAQYSSVTKISLKPSTALPTFTAPFIPVSPCTSHSPAQPCLPSLRPQSPYNRARTIPSSAPLTTDTTPTPCTTFHKQAEHMYSPTQTHPPSLRRVFPAPDNFFTSTAQSPWLGATREQSTAVQTASTGSHRQHTKPHMHIQTDGLCHTKVAASLAEIQNT